METHMLTVTESIPGEVEPFIVDESLHSVRLMAGLRHLRDRNQLFDVILIVEGREFSAHRVVLASCSDYFHAMFTNGLKETSQHCITLSGVTSPAMEQLIHFAYTSRLKITKENVVTLLSGASHVQMLPAIAACERYLCSHITLDNCLVMEQLADIYSLHKLTRNVHAYICRKWVEFVFTADFSTLTRRQLLAVLQSDFPVFCSETKVLEAVFLWLDQDLPSRAQHSEDLLRALQWENIQVKELGQLLGTAAARRVIHACPMVLNFMLQVFPSLSKEVKTCSVQNVSIVNIAYSRCSSHSAAKGALKNTAGARITTRGDGRDVTVTHTVIRQDAGMNCNSSLPQPNRTIVQVNNNPISIQSNIVATKLNWHPSCANVPGVVNSRGFYPALLLVGGFHVSHRSALSSNDILCLQPACDKLIWYTNIPHLPQTDFGLAVMDNCLYAVGGCCNEDFTEVTHPYAFKFNTVTSTWSSLPPMTQERCRFYLGSHGGLLYAVGGEVDNSQMLASCEVFDPQRAVWSPVASLPSSRSELAGCSLGNSLYLSGGWETRQDLHEQVYSNMWSYDSCTDSWTVRAAMPHARANHSMVAHNGRIFALSGWSLSNGEKVPVMAVDCYDPEKDSWQTVQHMKTARKYCTCTLLSGRVYVIGGVWDERLPVRDKREVDVLDLPSLQWQTNTVSIPNIWEHSAVAIHLPRKP